MKKTISTILLLTILTTPIISSTCFADEPKSNMRESYVQEPERRDQYKFHRLTKGGVAKFVGCVAAGAVTIAGAAVGGILAGAAAGFKFCEDLIPERVKERFPSCFKSVKSVDYKQEHDEGIFSKLGITFLVIEILLMLACFSKPYTMPVFKDIINCLGRY